MACFLRPPLCMSAGSSVPARQTGSGVTDVRITFVGLVQRLVGHREEMVSLPQEAILADLLQVLVKRHGQGLEQALLEQGELAAHATVLINGHNALTQGGLTAKLSGGAQSHIEIVLLGPPLMGG